MKPICIPVELDTELLVHADCNNPNCPLMAWGKRSKFWDKKTLYVKFINGDKKQIELSKKYFGKIESVCGIKFEYVSGNTHSDIRVAFYRNSGHWSYVGLDNTRIPQGSQTMNLELFRHTSEKEWSRVAVHEMLHALGFGHSQQNPEQDIPWNEPLVISHYKKTQGWSEAETRQQVLNQGSAFETFNTGYDKDSIMHYPVPNWLTIGDFQIGWNSSMSKKDVEALVEIYGAPKKNQEKIETKKTSKFRSLLKGIFS